METIPVRPPILKSEPVHAAEEVSEGSAEEAEDCIKEDAEEVA